MYYSVALLNAVLWPVLVLVVAILFQRQLKDLLKRLKKTRLPFDYDFFKSPYDDPHTLSCQEAAESLAELFATDKPASAYWLGHDLMWTIDMILRGAPKEYILRGLKQSLHHFNSVGLKNEPDGTLLTNLRVKIAGMLNEDITIQVRNKYAKELYQVISRTANYARKCQPKFDSGLP